MTASPWACVLPVLLDHASTSALTTGVSTKHVNRLPSTTSACPAVFKASNCPIGLCGATMVGPVQGRACGVEQAQGNEPHGPVCKRSRTRSRYLRRVLPLHRLTRPTVVHRRRFCTRYTIRMYLARISTSAMLSVF